MRIPTGLQSLIIGALTALLLEGVVRGMGYVPLAYRIEPPVMREQYAFDASRGYRMRSGVHTIRRPDGTSVTYRVSEEGERAVPEQVTADEEVLFVGDSFTFGEFVEDGEALPAQVQRRVTNLRVRNLGVSGYGTCQTMLTADLALRASQRSPLVVYGVNPLHAERNVASARQLWRLSYHNAGYSTLMPRCRFDREGRMSVEPPIVVMPFGPGMVSRSGLAVLLNEALFAARSVGEPAAEDLTLKLIAEFDRRVRARSGRLLLLLMDFESEALGRYRATLQRQEISYVELPKSCGVDACRIAQDGHPAPELYSSWAQLVSPEIRRLAGAVQRPLPRVAQ